MNFSFEQVMTILSLLATILGQAFIIVRYIMGKHDDLARALRAELAQQVITRDNALALAQSAREAAVAEIHRRLDQQVKSLHDFREHVGVHYVTSDSMRDVETRLSNAINATETRLTALLGKLESRIEARSHGAAE